MGFIQEFKEIKRNNYGTYCNMLTELGLKRDIVPYYEFNNELYNKIRKLYTQIKNNNDL